MPKENKNVRPRFRLNSRLLYAQMKARGKLPRRPARHIRAEREIQILNANSDEAIQEAITEVFDVLLGDPDFEIKEIYCTCAEYTEFSRCQHKRDIWNKIFNKILDQMC